MDDYINFALTRAQTFQEHLDESNMAQPKSVSNFLSRCGSYRELDHQTYQDAQPSFIWCGLMFEACTLVCTKGEKIDPPTWQTLRLAVRAVLFMVASIEL